MAVFDALVLACLTPLAVLTLISGSDDLVLDVAMVCGWIRRRFTQPDLTAPSDVEPGDEPEKRIAIFLPLWREHRVADRMLEHNIAAMRYQNYDFFVGAYPNDTLTVETVRDAERRFARVHLVLCPHDGPTSKGDCLNWIYQGMLLFEQARGVHFEVAVTHDAEDLIHPEALGVINRYTSRFDMVQIPVLPLPTPFRQLTHGVYCDEFAEFQTKDVPVRRVLGGFLPSNGVGTGYTRRALERLAETAGNRVFEPECLTEDYENGFRLHRLGFRQSFVPIRFMDGAPLATREYFPLTFRSAVKQRTRWVMGIALQTWERHGWGGTPAIIYWFWRDRKGLLGNPASLLGNFVFLYGLCTWLWSRVSGGAWGLESAMLHPLLARLLTFTLLLQCLRTSVRVLCSGRIYGWGFALGVPIRTVWANWMNSMATLLAIYRYGKARLKREPLVWLKTEHLYPSRQGLMQHKRKLGEILTESGYLGVEELESALASQPRGVRLGEHLVQLGILSEDHLYEALSVQQNVPVRHIEPSSVRRATARLLPARTVSSWRVLPVRVADGCLLLAGPELPRDEVERGLRRFTRLEIKFQLITPENFESLRKVLL